MAGDTLRADELISGASELAKEMAELNKQIKATAKTIITAKSAFDKQSTSQSDLSKKTTATKKAVTELEKIQKRANKVTLETIRATEALRDKRKKLTDQVRKENGTLKKSGGLFRSMTKSILAAGAAMLTIRAAFNIFKTGIKTIAGFEGAMSKVRAVTDATKGAFIALSANAKLLGSTTSKTAIEVSALQLSFSKLGFSTKEILAATEATISLSIAAGSDLAESATVAASTIRGFGLDASESQRVVDVMAKSFASSALDLEKFKSAMANAQVAAKTTGHTLEETASFLSVIADTGTDASKAGTDLRVIFSKLAIKGIDLNDALNSVENSSTKVATAQKLVGDRAFSSLITLAENRKKTDQLTKSYINSAGAAKRMADIMEDNLLGETKKLSSAWEGFILSLNKGEGSISNFLRGAVKLGTNFLRLITDTEKESEALGRMRIEMNANLEAIKNQELPLDVRNRLIENLNTQYKDYLPNLIDEKTSLEDIEAIQKQANKALLENIRIKAQQELLTEQINKIAELEVKIAKQQIRVEKLKSGEISFTASAYLSQEEQISGLNVTIKRLIEEYQKEVVELDKIQSIFDKLNPKQEESNKLKEKSKELTTEELTELDKLRKAQLKIDEEVEQERLTAFQKAKKKQEKIDLESDKKLIAQKKAILEGSDEERNDALIARLKEEYDIKIAAAEALTKKELEIDKAKDAVKIAAAEAAGQILSDQFSGFIDNNLAEFQAGQDAEQKILDDKLDKGILSEKEFERQSANLAKRGRIESAKAEKKKAIFDTTLAAAVSVIKQLAATPLPAGAPFIAAAAGIGAAQIAVAVAQPIPKFKDSSHGVLNKDTTAIVGDGGKPELITTPQGDFLSPSTDTLVNLPRGSQVFSGDSPETQAALSGGMSDEHYNGLIAEQRATRKAIANQPRDNWKLTDSGLTHAHIMNNTKLNFLNDWIKK